MMVSSIAPLLIASAAGYWVLTLAGREKGRIKTLGNLIGLIIIVISLAGAGLKIYCCLSACASSGKMGMMNCPYTGRMAAPPASMNKGM